MGLTSSSTAAATTQRRKPELTEEQKLQKYLGERFPFSDGELLVLQQSFQEWDSRGTTSTSNCCEDDGSSTSVVVRYTHSSFLLELALYSLRMTSTTSNIIASNEGDETATNSTVECLHFILEKLLPCDFSSKLQSIAFLELSSSTNANTSSDSKTTNIHQPRLEAFLEGVTKCCGRKGAHYTLEILYRCCCNTSATEDMLSTEQVPNLVYLTYKLALACHLLLLSKTTNKSFEKNHILSSTIQSAPSTAALQCLIMSLSSAAKTTTGGGGGGTSNNNNSNNSNISMYTFIQWVNQTMPLLPTILPTFMQYILFPNLPPSPGRQLFHFPTLNDTSSIFTHDFSPRLFSFACMSLALGGSWHRLYSSDTDGLSFNRLQLALMGYAGPTIMILRDASSGGIFGAFTSSTWKESKDFYGTSDCFLYQLEPITNVYRTRGMDRNYMYCNSAARSRGYDQLVHGLGFGGGTTSTTSSSSTMTKPRLFVSECFDECSASPNDTTFEYGPLLPNNQKDFDIDTLEVWGCGGDTAVQEALDARTRTREVIDANVRKAKKVDKAAFLDDFNSGLIESKAFKHREEIRGREGAGCA